MKSSSIHALQSLIVKSSFNHFPVLTGEYRASIKALKEIKTMKLKLTILCHTAQRTFKHIHTTGRLSTQQSSLLSEYAESYMKNFITKQDLCPGVIINHAEIHAELVSQEAVYLGVSPYERQD